jgi:hypothetical protein
MNSDMNLFLLPCQKGSLDANTLLDCFLEWKIFTKKLVSQIIINNLNKIGFWSQMMNKSTLLQLLQHVTNTQCVMNICFIFLAFLVRKNFPYFLPNNEIKLIVSRVRILKWRITFTVWILQSLVTSMLRVLHWSNIKSKNNTNTNKS